MREVLAEHPAATDDSAAMERLHPLTMVAGIGGVFRSAWGALAAAGYLAYSGREWIAAAIVGFAILSAFLAPLIRYLSFSFRVEDDEIDLHSGILNRNHRSIPFDRVQDVNIEQNPIARLLGLAKVKLESGASAGGGEEDGVIDSITLERANALRDRIRAHRSGVPVAFPGETTAPTEAAAEGPPLYAMDTRRLLLAGFFNFSLAVVGALFGVVQTYGDVLGFDLFEERFWRDLLASSGPLQAFVLANQVITALFGILSLALFGLATGIVRTTLREWGFRLDRTESGFRRRRGLLTLTDVVLPLKRVQAAILLTGPVRRWFGFTSLKLQSLARDSAKTGDHTVAPLSTPDEAETILAELDWRPLPETAGWKRPSLAYLAAFLLLLLPFAAAAVAVILAGEWWGLAALGALGLLGLARLVDWLRRRHRIDGDRFLMRSGWWRDRLVVLPLRNIQSADVHRGPIDRLFGIAGIRLGVAGGSGFSAHGVHALPHDDALALRARLLEGFA